MIKLNVVLVVLNGTVVVGRWLLLLDTRASTDSFDSRCLTFKLNLTFLIACNGSRLGMDHKYAVLRWELTLMDNSHFLILGACNVLQRLINVCLHRIGGRRLYNLSVVLIHKRNSCQGLSI